MATDHSWRRYRLLADWPAQDQAAWAAATAEGRILDGRGSAAHWAEATRRTNQHHYGRWLAYLNHFHGPLQNCTPEDRVTKQAVKSYIDHLRDELAPRTIVSSLVGLKVMMMAMAPQTDWRWLADACNALNRSAKPSVDKRSRMLPTGQIYAAAIAELQRLLTTPLTKRLDRVAYRDTLMLGVLAARPIRLKNFTAIVIGTHLVQDERGWSFIIPGEEVKNGQHLEFGLPASIVPFLEAYLERVRPTFGPYPGNLRLWLGFEGQPLDYHSIYWRFQLVTPRLLGVRINPHLLRDCAATSLSTESPDVVQSAAALLGHRTFSTTQKYYIRANRLEASRTLNAILAAARKLR